MGFSLIFRELNRQLRKPVKDQLSEETVLKEAAEANIETTTVVKILTETEAIGTKGPEASFKE
jgi:hypothetical protein